MRPAVKKTLAAVGLIAACITGLGMQSAAPIRVLLVTGQNNHDWRSTTPVLEKLLAEAKLFEVTTVTVEAGRTATFAPEWERYDVVVSNYNGEEWPAETKTAFERYMSNGGGFVPVHAADNAFPRWPAYNEMIGIGGWGGRNETCGPYWYYRGDELVSDNSPGRGGSHPGNRLPFRANLRTPDHPITRGLPATWLHHTDELYATMRGPGKNMTVLVSGESNPELRGGAGTGRDEPQLMALSYGEGRIFHTTWGHDAMAMASVDFITTFLRGVEWAATGAVTQPVPASFPTADAVSYRWDILRMDPTYAQPAPAPAAAQAPAMTPGGPPPAARPAGAPGQGGGAGGCVAPAP